MLSREIKLKLALSKKKQQRAEKSSSCGQRIFRDAYWKKIIKYIANAQIDLKSMAFVPIHIGLIHKMKNDKFVLRKAVDLLNKKNALG